MGILLTMLTLTTAHFAKPFERIKNPSDRYLVFAEKISRVSAAQLKETYSSYSFLVKNGFSSYRITYNTHDENGNVVIASGALFVPDITTALPLMNYNHGTIFPSREKSAPSYFQDNSVEPIIGKLFAASGYLAILPDYVGYGSSKNSSHSYGAYKVIALTVIDMLYAVKEFCHENKIMLSDKNFFSGWSEGAAVALAVVKRLEEQNDKTFIPTASVLNAGPYYTSGFVNHILEADKPLTYMRTYVWVLRSYNRIYKINKPDTYYFTQPAAEELHNDPEAHISQDPSELFTSEFKSSYLAGKDTALQNAFLQNDLWNWKPVSRIVFCHGDRDEYVPVFNSQKTYDEMKEKGADVSLHIFKGQTHTSGVLSFLQDAFSEFEKQK